MNLKVYVAWLNGKKLAVKVQRPGLLDMFSVDFKVFLLTTLFHCPNERTWEDNDHLSPLFFIFLYSDLQSIDLLATLLDKFAPHLNGIGKDWSGIVAECERVLYKVLALQ